MHEEAADHREHAADDGSLVAENEALIANAAVKVRVTLDENGPLIEVAAPEGAGALVSRPAASGEVLRWSLHTVESANGVAISLVGASEQVVHAIGITMNGDSRWLEISESRTGIHGTLTPTDAFQSRWTFSGGPIREVFTPNLVPEATDLIGQHVMRAPVLAVEAETAGASIVVDVRSLATAQALPAALDFIRDNDRTATLTVGLHAQTVRGHVFYRTAPAPVAWDASSLSHAYFLTVLDQPDNGEVLATARAKVWESGQTGEAGPALGQSAADYAKQIYPHTLERLWAETTIDGRRVGAITSNRSYAGDVWFSAWFNPVISSYGLFHFGQLLGREDWVQQARATRALALSAPLADGLFPTVFVFGDDRWVGSHHQGGGPGIYHLMDMSWTLYQLLRWNRDLEPDAETIERARVYARELARLQRSDGGLPAYVDRDHRPVREVDHTALLDDLAGHGGDPYVPGKLANGWSDQRFTVSAEDSASLLFLAELAAALPAHDESRDAVLETAREVARFLAEQVIPDARWTDFEVYFSCSVKDLSFFDHRSGQWPQNTLVMQHAAAGLLRLSEVTGDASYLALGRRAMDRMSLYQQVWNPSWLGLSAVGGYGVMNTDGEWNDARQAQFAETHLAYAAATGESEHAERAIAAARAAFTTVFLPASASRYRGWWRTPWGMAAENHGHAGNDELNGVSGFDWGSGSALAAAAYFDLQGVGL